MRFITIAAPTAVTCSCLTTFWFRNDIVEKQIVDNVQKDALCQGPCGDAYRAGQGEPALETAAQAPVEQAPC